MPEFTNEEYVEMLLIYGEVRRNTAEAQRIWRERFPNSRIPHRNTFENVRRRLAETGSLAPRSFASARLISAQNEEHILDLVHNDPQISTRAIAARLRNVSQPTVHRILRENRLHPYHFQSVQGLVEGDYLSRRVFCEWLLQQDEQDDTFLSRILFTDEATFGRDSTLNLHNLHVYATENPRATIEGSHQWNFSINIWCGMIGSTILGPCVLPRLSATTYLEFLSNTVQDVLDDLPLAVRRNMWFMHDGAPAHYSARVRNYLDQSYGVRWIGRAGPVSWPARSPDLNPLDFYLWGHIKDMVYSRPVTSRDQLLEQIMSACERIRGISNLDNRIIRSLRRRARLCIRQNGGYFEHLLH